MAKNYHNVRAGGQGDYELRSAVEASGAVSPGQLVEYAADAGTYQTHSAAGERTSMFIAEVMPYSGDSEDDTSPLSDAYADGEAMNVVIAPPKTRVLCRLADAEDPSIGDALVSNGDGNFAVHVDEAEGAKLGIVRETYSVDDVDFAVVDPV